MQCPWNYFGNLSHSIHKGGFFSLNTPSRESRWFKFCDTKKIPNWDILKFSTPKPVYGHLPQINLKRPSLYGFLKFRPLAEGHSQLNHFERNRPLAAKKPLAAHTPLRKASSPFVLYFEWEYFLQLYKIQYKKTLNINIKNNSSDFCFDGRRKF